MQISDKIQFATLLVAIISLVVTEAIGNHQRSKQDKRSDLKLRIFEILGSESKTLEEITEAHRSIWGPLTTDELRKAIYEMLSEETAFYESTNTYRAHWRNPKEKDWSEPPASLGDRAVQLPPNPAPAGDA